MPEIYTLDSNEIEPESSELYFNDEWCPNESDHLHEVDVGQISAVMSELSSAGPSPPCQSSARNSQILDNKTNKWKNKLEGKDERVPETLPAFQAVNWNGHLGADLRPHVWDAQLNKFLLCDSGSQITAWPPDLGDKPVPGSFMRAVNGSRIKTYGYKDISVKIGRKTYDFKAIKAEVDSPVLGWDFMRHHRLELIWNDWGDNCIYDKKAKITTTLTYKSMPTSRSRQMKNLALISAAQRSGRCGMAANELVFQISSMKGLGDNIRCNDQCTDSMKALTEGSTK